MSAQLTAPSTASHTDSRQNKGRVDPVRSTRLLLAGNSRELQSQNCFGLFLIDVGHQRNPASASGFRRQRCNVGAVDILQPELARARHQLAQSLRYTLIVRVEPNRSSRQFVETITVLPAVFGRA